MILAGGLSTRLYPLTKSVPKPLVPIAGVPNAIHLMRYLKAYGFDEIVINLHYLADAIVERSATDRTTACVCTIRTNRNCSAARAG